MRLGIVLLGWVAMATGGCALRPRYAEVGQSLGVTRLVEEGVVQDAEAVELYAVDPLTRRPIPGLKLSLRQKGKPVRRVTDESGHTSLPVSRASLAENALLEVERPRGVDSYQWRAALPHPCGPRAAGAVVTSAQVTRWPKLDLGPDRLHAPAKSSAAVRDRALEVLGAARQALTRVAGVRPPPLAVALTDERLEPGATDGEGRALLALSPTTLDTSALLHGWAHSLLWRTVRVAGDARTRYLEEGLVEVLAAEASGAPVETRWSAWAQALEGAGPGSVDLLARSQAHDPFAAANPRAAVAARCGVEGRVASALAVAFWLELRQQVPDLLPRLAQRLERRADTGAEALLGHLAAVAPGSPEPRVAQPEKARALLLPPAPAPAVVEPAPAPEP